MTRRGGRARTDERTATSPGTNPPLLVDPLGRAAGALSISAIRAGSRRFACGKRSTFVDWVRIEIIDARRSAMKLVADGYSSVSFWSLRHFWCTLCLKTSLVQ